MTRQRAIHRLTQAIFTGVLAVGGVGALSAASPERAAVAQASANRDAGAERFVQIEVQRVVSILSDAHESNPDKIRIFRAIVDEIADVPRIGSFVLGKYARSISPAQRERFLAVFREYAQNVYETRLGAYHGETVRVTGSLARKPGDVVVNTMISGGQLTGPLPVAWRVLGSGSSWKVVDVQVRGIWLAIAQQQDFVSTMDNHGGDIDALISQLQRQTQQHNTRTR